MELGWLIISTIMTMIMVISRSFKNRKIVTVIMIMMRMKTSKLAVGPPWQLKTVREASKEVAGPGALLKSSWWAPSGLCCLEAKYIHQIYIQIYPPQVKYIHQEELYPVWSHIWSSNELR